MATARAGGSGFVAERERIRKMFTLDARDCRIYRPPRVGRFSVIP